MAGQPKAPFYIVLFLVVAGLVGACRLQHSGLIRAEEGKSA